jgi:hypothetical protein
MRKSVLFTDLFNFAFRRNARVPMRAGQEQARSCVTFVAGTRERKAAIWGYEEKQGSHLSLLCPLHAPCRVRMQAKK